METLVTVDATSLAFIAFGLASIALGFTMILVRRQRLLLQRYRQLLNGTTGQDLESILVRHAEQLHLIDQHLGQVDQQLATMTEQMRPHLQKTALLRYNAFPDTGSDLSFVIAMLNADNDGFVLSSLYGRNEGRVYAKPIRSGVSTYTLSDEEKSVLSQAIGVTVR